MLQNGRRVGIHVIATAPGRTGVPTSLGSTFGRRIVLRMTTNDDYLMLGVPGNVLDADTLPGAGLLGKRSGAGPDHRRRGHPAAGRADRDHQPPAAPRAPRARPRPRCRRCRPGSTSRPSRRRAARGWRSPSTPTRSPCSRSTCSPGRCSSPAGPRSGRTGALDGLQALVARGDRPADGHPRARLRLHRRRGGALGRGTFRPRSPDGWALVMVDDAHLWDAGVGVDEARRTARDRLLGVLGAHGHRIGLVVTADTAQAKARGGPEGLVETARRARRGFLLQPEWADGDALGVSVPTKTTEPLTGPGRGVWCDGRHRVGGAGRPRRTAEHAPAATTAAGARHGMAQDMTTRTERDDDSAGRPRGPGLARLRTAPRPPTGRRAPAVARRRRALRARRHRLAGRRRVLRPGHQPHGGRRRRRPDLAQRRARPARSSRSTRPPAQLEVKQVVGNPGDDLEVTGQYDGQLYVTDHTTGQLLAFDLTSILVSGQRRVSTGGAVDTIYNDDGVFLVDGEQSTIAAMDPQCAPTPSAPSGWPPRAWPTPPSTASGDDLGARGRRHPAPAELVRPSSSPSTTTTTQDVDGSGAGLGPGRPRQGRHRLRPRPGHRRAGRHRPRPGRRRPQGDRQDLRPREVAQRPGAGRGRRQRLRRAR